ncbi:hypothetical protein [Paenibacillus xylanexedens]|uniref:hypothetical protein n=1 Tax=Paenibacillus xylanexedens TaxID=528191 RepID=UPI000F547674|nr:hypothetical protein [Paenibacillus xylanexedens]
MSIYKNDRLGRDRILDEIGSLVEQGYARQDYLGSSVVLEKAILKGKRCTHNKVVRYVFHAGKQEIYRQEEERFDGIKDVRDLLYGWSSPIVECHNALRAGLLDENDVSIYKMQYTDRSWILGE